MGQVQQWGQRAEEVLEGGRLEAADCEWEGEREGVRGNEEGRECGRDAQREVFAVHMWSKL